MRIPKCKKHYLVASLLAMAVVLMFCSTAFGQATSGDLVGTVVDSSGALIPNAKIVAVNVATGVTGNTTTNASGEYRFGNLLVGTYNVTANAGGFAPKTLQVVVELNKTATGRITLDIGPAATTVEVSGVAAVIDTTTAQLQATYDNRQTQDLPITGVGSGVLNLSLLQAGVGSSGGMGAGSGPSVGGQRPRNNNFTVEGVDNNDKGVTGPGITIPNDAVQNLTVMTNQYSPEFGHSTGGQFNQVIVSGTNTFHGMAYEYMRNRNLNAIDVSNQHQGLTKNPRYDNNRFGGQLGGPVFKNKLFFFGNFTYQPIGQSATPSSNIYAPTAAGYSTLAGISSVNQNNVNMLKQYATAGSSCKGASGCPTITVAGKTVDVGVLPIVAPNFTNNKFLVTSMDWNISDKDQLRGRYVYNKSASVDTAAYLPVFYMNITTPYHLVALSQYHTFSPSVTNELRAGFNRWGTTWPVPDFKFTGLDAFPNITLEDMNMNLGPDPNAPQYSIQNVYQLTDNLTWVKGNHTFKFGIDAAKYISPQLFIQRARGDYLYGNSEVYFLDHVPDSLAERSFGTVGYSGDQYWIYGYANDTWKIRPTISLTLGLRYEYLSTPFGWTQQNLNSVADTPGVITFGSPKAPTKDFAPRLGFAWAPGSGNTSIRGGFGMGYDVLYDNIGTLSRPPQIGSTTDCPGQAGCAPDTAFLKNGGIKPTGQSGITTLSRADAIAYTASYLPNEVKYPYSMQWNLGVQHVFKDNYTLEVRYVGTRGVHLNVQNRINRINRVDKNNNLPLYYTAPTQSQLDGLTTTLDTLKARPQCQAYFTAAGFCPSVGGGNIVAFMPYGGSNYHGLATQLNRRFSNGLQFQLAWTWSHTIDDSTADFFSTVLTPRRQEDFQNLRADRSNSALDRANRVTLQFLYDVPWFKNHSNWLAKNIVGNWEFAPIYTFETGEWASLQSSADANLNGDGAGDRVIINPNGSKTLSSGVTALKNTAGKVVAYRANNPNAYYIRADQGMLTNAGRNILQIPPINNWDMSLIKRFAVTERFKFEFGARLLNAFNHPQFIGGYINDIGSIGPTSAAATSFLIPGSANFNNPSLTFASNARTVQLFGKLSF